MPRLWCNIFFFHWLCSFLLMKLQEKNWTNSFMAYQCLDCVFFLHWFCSWLFMKLQKKLQDIFHGISMSRLWCKVSHLILFLTFHEASAKKMEGIFHSILMPRVWCKVSHLILFWTFPLCAGHVGAYARIRDEHKSWGMKKRGYHS